MVRPWLSPGTQCGNTRAPEASVPASSAQADSTCPDSSEVSPHLGTECCLFMEIAVHELTVLSSGDLTAGGTERKEGA